MTISEHSFQILAMFALSTMGVPVVQAEIIPFEPDMLTTS